MLAPFPETHRIQVSEFLARELSLAAERLPLYDNKEFYSVELQQFVHDSIREANTEGFDTLVNSIKERLRRRPYCVLVSGLRFDEGNRLFVALNRAFGELVARPYEKPRAQLVHYIQPQTDMLSARGGHESERLHTDCADWETPVELISMVCVNADNAGGGRSRVLDLDSIRNGVTERLGPAALKLFEDEPAPWQLAPYLGGGIKWRPVLTENSVCWRRYTIDLALTQAGASLSEEMLRALEGFEEVVTNTTDTVDFMMREGELLFSDNTRTIHARTPLADPATSTRLMIRSWIRTS
ncbi:MAG TPA: TauD/TfdA family dioxygenase [Pyrinomonadaceae bacterium]|nr:TauD/TfdA family dioxygenase [Pyrinomonadaceae bacterium]